MKIEQSYFQQINTLDVFNERFKLIKQRVTIPAPTTAEERKQLRKMYVELLKYYREQIKEIKENILPRLTQG